MVLAAKGGIKMAPERALTSPAQRYYIPPEGGALKPSGRRQPVPDRTLAAQGRKAQWLAQPSRPKRRVNLREYWKAPPRSLSQRHIQGHHNHESQGEGNDADIGMLTL